MSATALMSVSALRDGDPSELPFEAAQRELIRLVQQVATSESESQLQPAQVWVAELSANPNQPQELRVRGTAGVWLSVQRAHSCLTPPQAGDLVQLVQAESQCWVLAVLVSARADEGVVLDAAGRALTVQAQDLHLQASRALVQESVTSTQRSRMTIQTCQERQTRVQGTDAHRAGSVLTHVERHHSVHAESATLTATSLLKVDAAQIHMG